MGTVVIEKKFAKKIHNSGLYRSFDKPAKYAGVVTYQRGYLAYVFKKLYLEPSKCCEKMSLECYFR
jgi:hypothetical protein